MTVNGSGGQSTKSYVNQIPPEVQSQHVQIIPTIAEPCHHLGKHCGGGSETLMFTRTHLFSFRLFHNHPSDKYPLPPPTYLPYPTPPFFLPLSSPPTLPRHLPPSPSPSLPPTSLTLTLPPTSHPHPPFHLSHPHPSSFSSSLITFSVLFSFLIKVVRLYENNTI